MFIPSVSNKMLTLFCLVCLCTLGCKTTQTLTKGKQSPPNYRYQSHLNEGESVVKEDYNTILSKTGLGELIYRQIYPEKDFMTKYIEFADPQYLVISGRYIEWYDNGNLKTKGQCYEDLREGEWIEYFPNTGTKKASGYYLQDLKEGEWLQYNLQGVHTHTLTYVNGVCQADYVTVDQAGNEFQKTGNPEGVKTLPYLSKHQKLKTAEARHKATFSTIQSKVVANIEYPSHLRDLRIKGVTETVIEIGPDGKVLNIEVLTGICQAFTDESIRLAKLLGDWSPGTCEGLPCTSEYRLFVDF